MPHYIRTSSGHLRLPFVVAGHAENKRRRPKDKDRRRHNQPAADRTSAASEIVRQVCQSSLRRPSCQSQKIRGRTRHRWPTRATFPDAITANRESWVVNRVPQTAGRRPQAASRRPSTPSRWFAGSLAFSVLAPTSFLGGFGKGTMLFPVATSFHIICLAMFSTCVAACK
jgi:hypothetical protein